MGRLIGVLLLSAIEAAPSVLMVRPGVGVPSTGLGPGCEHGKRISYMAQIKGRKGNLDVEFAAAIVAGAQELGLLLLGLRVPPRPIPYAHGRGGVPKKNGPHMKRAASGPSSKGTD
jgi:hypothetical protein